MYKNTLLLIALWFVPAWTFASGKIKGTVTDQQSGATLISVSLRLIETDQQTVQSGTLSGPDGTFEMDVPAGDYQLVLEYMGYETKKITNIHLEDQATVLLKIEMTPKSNNELETVVVSSRLKRSSLNALYTLRQNAPAVSDGIAAETIRKSPDRNAGEVLKRVSGTTIQDNKFVIIRGLNDRYNTALIDGALMPSTEANRKAFSFNIVPSGMIDNIIIYKSATPDMPGNFSGGAINILTKEVPETSFNRISVGTGFETTATGKPFRSGYRGATDFLGFTGSNRKLPADFPSQSVINQHPEKSVENLSRLHNDFGIREHTAPPPLSLSFAAGRRYYLRQNRWLGITAALRYAHKESIRDHLIRQYDNYNYSDNIYEYHSTLGGLFNIAYLAPRSKISLKTFYNRILDDQLLLREGTNFGTSSSIRYYAFDLIEKSLFKSTLSGAHQLRSEKEKISWLLSYNHIANARPDQRKVSYSRAADDEQATYFANITTLGKANNRLFSRMGETITNGRVSYQLPLHLLEETLVKVGVSGQYRHRDFYNRYLGAVLDPMYPNSADIRQLPIDRIFSDPIIAKGPYFLEDQTLDADEYHANAQTFAGFLMLDQQITSALRVIWGARMERYHVAIATRSKQVAEKQWLDWLPSVNIVYALNEEMNLRGAYFKSIARPEFREMTNLPYYDYELSATMGGNPALKRTRIHNMDIRFEWFPNAGEVLSATIFYKRFLNAIESRVYGANSSYDITPFNSSLANNFGLELEVRKSLSFLSNNALLERMGIYLNLAWIQSSVATDDLFVRGRQLDRRPLSGQAPYVLNTGLEYRSENGKLNLNLLYNRIGQRLTFIGQDRMGMLYERPRNLLDFQAGYALTSNSSLRFSAENILNEPVLFYFDQNSDGRYNGSAFAGNAISDGKDWIWKQYRPGLSFSFTYTYTF